MPSWRALAVPAKPVPKPVQSATVVWLNNEDRAVVDNKTIEAWRKAPRLTSFATFFEKPQADWEGAGSGDAGTADGSPVVRPRLYDLLGHASAFVGTFRQPLFRKHPLSAGRGKPPGCRDPSVWTEGMGAQRKACDDLYARSGRRHSRTIIGKTG